MLKGLFISVLLSLPALAWAQTAQSANSPASAASSSTASGPTGFFDGWAPGIAMVRNSRKVVTDATIVNGSLVRANTEQLWQASVLLEYHWYFADKQAQCSMTVGQLGCLGLFLGAGISGGSNQVIDLLGGGLIFGWGPQTQDAQRQRLNFGVGVGRRFNVKMLGDGFSQNAPPPNGETQVRYKNSDLGAAFLFFSYKL